MGILFRFRNVNNHFWSSNRPLNLLFNQNSHHCAAYSAKSFTPGQSKELIKATSHPVPIFSIRYTNYHETPDPALVLLEKKKEHTAIVSKTRKRARENGRTFGESFKQVMEQMPFDPSPHIDGVVDWHFSGGNLELLTIHDNDVLASSSMCTDYSVRLFKPTSEFNHLELESSPKCIQKNFGYEVMQSDSFLGVRHQKSVDLFWRYMILEPETTLKPEIVYKWPQELAASALFDENLLLLDVNKLLTWCSIEKMKAIKTLKLKQEDEFPFTLCRQGQNVVTFTAKKSLNQVDFREGKIRRLFDDEEMFMGCEQLTCQQRSSVHENILYLGSSHYLYGLDLRSTDQLQLQWAHQLMLPPTMIKTAKFRNSEVICLANNEPDDIKIFNCSKSSTWKMNWMSVKPIHQKSSYDKMRFKGMLLTHSEMKRRLQLSTTGIAIVPDEKRGKIALNTQNSLGDVFKSYLWCRKEQIEVDESRIKENFLSWGSFLEPRIAEQPILDLTTIVNLKGVAKVLTGEKVIHHDETPEELSAKAKPSWQCDIEEAREYKDVLANVLLSAWDLDIADTQPKAFAEAFQTEETSSTKAVDKVSRWLQKTDDVVNETINVDEDSQFESCFNSSVGLVTSTQQPGPSGTAKKTKRVSRIKGF